MIDGDLGEDEDSEEVIDEEISDVKSAYIDEEQEDIESNEEKSKIKEPNNRSGKGREKKQCPYPWCKAHKDPVMRLNDYLHYLYC